MNNRKRTRPAQSFNPPADGICPICLRKTEPADFRGHHIVGHADGGCERPLNIILLCQSCHMLIENGTRDDIISRSWLAWHYKLWKHGLQFALYWTRMKKKSTGVVPELRDRIREYPSRREADRALRMMGGQMYATFAYDDGEDPPSGFPPNTDMETEPVRRPLDRH